MSKNPFRNVVQRHRLMAVAAEDDRPLQAEFEIPRRLERNDKLRVNIIVVGIGVSLL